MSAEATRQKFDRSARKFHQLALVATLVAAYVVDGVAAAALVAFAGAVMLVGRFWWPADVFRQLAWRVLEPAGILPRRDVVEDHETRRVARILGGTALLAAAAGVAAGIAASWLLIAAMAAMIFLDGVFDI